MRRQRASNLKASLSSKTKTKYFLENPQLTLDQQRILYADPEKTIKYLGTTLIPWKKLNLNPRNPI